MKQEIIWIAVADSHDVKIFQTIKNKKGEPQLVREIKFESEPNDKSGRTFDSMGSGRHAIEPHTNPKDVERQHFANEISHFLCESVNYDGYDEMICENI